eukprot:scaffold18888_cov69-Phaeocystis_antarctica.AAC.2
MSRLPATCTGCQTSTRALSTPAPGAPYECCSGRGGCPERGRGVAHGEVHEDQIVRPAVVRGGLAQVGLQRLEASLAVPCPEQGCRGDGKVVAAPVHTRCLGRAAVEHLEQVGAIAARAVQDRQTGRVAAGFDDRVFADIAVRKTLVGHPVVLLGSLLAVRDVQALGVFTFGQAAAFHGHGRQHPGFPRLTGCRPARRRADDGEQASRERHRSTCNVVVACCRVTFADLGCRFGLQIWVADLSCTIATQICNLNFTANCTKLGRARTKRQSHTAPYRTNPPSQQLQILLSAADSNKRPWRESRQPRSERWVLQQTNLGSHPL